MFLSRDFKFDAAHYLPKYHGKCERLHGHTYKFRVTIEGQPNKEGMILDFAEVKKIVKKQVLDKLDHSNLNDLMKNPSAENIALWIWQQLQKKLKLFEVQVWESEGSSVTVRREDVS